MVLVTVTVETEAGWGRGNWSAAEERGRSTLETFSKFSEPRREIPTCGAVRGRKYAFEWS